MKITKAKFIKSAPSLKDCPEFNMPEFALIGRSNVGKSSFINSVVNIKGLAKTSNTPGKTKLINFFNVDDLFIFADLPGYGYAKVTDKTRNIWQKTLEEYLLKRNSIVSLIQLIDARHPVQKNDLQMAEWIKHNNLPFFVIASKVDEIKRSQINTVCKNFEKTLNTKVLPFCKSDNYYNKDITALMEEIITKSRINKENV